MWTNPYIHWLVERRAWPSTRKMLVAAPQLWLTAAAVMLTVSQPQSGWLFWISVVTIPLAALAGPLVGAVLLTFNELQSEQYQLIKLANLSEAALVHGFALNTLGRIHLLVVVSAALSPVIVIGWAYHLLAADMARWCALGVDVCKLAAHRFDPLQVIGLLFLSATTTAAIMSVTLTVIAVGEWMTFRWRNRAIALGTSSVILGIGLLPLVFFFILYLAASLHSLLHSEGWLPFVVISLTAMLMAVIPFQLIGAASLRTAGRWVCRS